MHIPLLIWHRTICDPGSLHADRKRKNAPYNDMLSLHLHRHSYIWCVYCCATSVPAVANDKYSRLDEPGLAVVWNHKSRAKCIGDDDLHASSTLTMHRRHAFDNVCKGQII